MNRSGRYARKTPKVVGRASGSALVIALLILLAMTILGVATLSSVNMQERMAGNANLQSLAFEAASSGLSEALRWAFEPASGLAFGNCRRADGPWSSEQPWSSPVVLELDENADQTVRIEYSLRNDCLEDPDFAGFLTVDGSPFQPPVQFFVTSEGTVFAADDTPLARREIEVRIDSVRGDGLSAIRVEGQAQIDFDAANSNSFVVNGGGGPAISTSTPGNAALIAQDILDKDRIGNYSGGVLASPYPPPFNTADGLAKFALRLREYMVYRGIGNAPSSAHGCDAGAGMTMRFIDVNENLTGDATLTGITYIAGNLRSNGNVSGSGLVIVEGDIDLNGTPSFNGLIVGLGGLFDMSGGGQGTTNGMLFATNLAVSELQDEMEAIRGSNDNWLVRGLFSALPEDPDDPDSGLIQIFAPGRWAQIQAEAPWLLDYDLSDPDLRLDYPEILGIALPGSDGFGPTRLVFGGGGNHSVNYDCSAVDGIREFLATCRADLDDYYPDDPPPEAILVDPDSGLAQAPWSWNARLVDDWPDFECNVPGRGAAMASIRSWRENLGWRELLNN